MAKRIKVVSDSAPAQREPRKIIATADNPKVSNRLTQNEMQARIQQKLVTSTTMGRFRTAADVLDSGTAQFYSPQLSTDFLEKPQNLRERRAFYRFFYYTNEIVGRAIDIHTTLPLSKIRLVPPKGKNKHQNEYVFKFYERMCDDMKLFRTLIDITHEFNLFGNAFIFAEEGSYLETMTEEDKAQKKDEARKRSEYLKTQYGILDRDPLYRGWKKLVVLPPDQVRVRKLPLSDDVAVEYTPDAETRKYITADAPLYPNEEHQKYPEIPEEIREKVRQSGVIPLDTDPNTGSFVFHLSNKKSQYEPTGQSIIERCVNTLVLMDKLRQAQTSIASRHMTPMRIVWAENLNAGQIDELREQVDMALVDPDFSIIANYEVHWEEMGSSGRLLDIESDYESAMNLLFAGLGVTREILTGEGSYTGSRISLEIMNTQYLLYREVIQDYVENYLFKPIARKKGFIEYDDYGNEVLLYPKLSFTRLAIRDNETFFDAAFQLYQKGSISIDLILDILNIDPEATKEKIEKDLLTVNDNQFNELMRNIYSNAATGIIESTDLVPKLAEYMKLKPIEKAEKSERFSSEKPKGTPVDKKEKMAKLLKYMELHPEVLDRIVPDK